jgi:replicative DNA helicase
MTTLNSLEKYGTSFQIKVLGALLTQRQFLLNIFDSLESEYFSNSAHQWIVDFIIKYFSEYHTIPSLETLSIEVKKIDNEILRIALTEQLREAYKAADDKDLEYVETEFTAFCGNQQMKKALMTSVDLLNIGDFDGIRRLINNAMKAGEDKNIGHEYELDIETRYRLNDRAAIPFPWPVFNDLTQGGVGNGDLVLMFGNPGGGKSWAVIAMGAFAAALGYNVVHYTLELGEGYVGKRYDAVFSGIPVDKLDDHREQVEEIIKQVKGKIVIKEYAPKRASLETIEAHIQQLENQNEFKPDIIILDYLDLLKGKGGRKERKDEIDDVYTEAKGLAKTLNIPIVSPSQANRTGAGKSIIEGDNAAGSYDKIMIGDIIISVARNRKDKVNGTGKWHIMKNRYGADGLTFRSTIDTSNGKIVINDQPVDDDDEEEKKSNAKVGYSNFDSDDRDILKKKFFDLSNVTQ